MENQNQSALPQTQVEPNQKGHIKYGLSVAIIFICLVAAFIAVYWIKIQPLDQIFWNYWPMVKSQNAVSSIEYTNTDYGFTFSLPDSWKGYSIVNENWNGIIGESQAVSGPEILIRNPKWTAQNPYQDIPVMLFTLKQWDDVLSEKMPVSAAPIPPSELGRNANYVFALPARYNYAYPTGWQEVDNILKGNPLKPIDADVSGWQTYQNDEHGFEIKYPADWKLYTDKNPRAIFGLYTPNAYDKILKCEKDNPQKDWNIDCGPFYADSEAVLFENTYVDYYSLDSVLKTNYKSYQKLEIGSLDIFSYEANSDPPTFNYHINSTDKKTGLEFIKYGYGDQYQNLVRQIISTFKFTK